jgi:hypothetical protein
MGPQREPVRSASECGRLEVDGEDPELSDSQKVPVSW